MKRPLSCFRRCASCGRHGKTVHGYGGNSATPAMGSISYVSTFPEHERHTWLHASNAIVLQSGTHTEKRGNRELCNCHTCYQWAPAEQSAIYAYITCLAALCSLH